MNLKGMFKKNPVKKSEPEPVKEVEEKAENPAKNPEVPDGLWIKCPSCRKTLLYKDMEASHQICPKCGTYLRMTATDRISLLADHDSFEEWDTGLKNRNPLRMKEYPNKIKLLKKATGNDEAVVTGKAMIGKIPVVLMVMDCHFLTASMGEVVGEKITRGIEKATELKLPVVTICCSGGARMQEGIVSLMQMAKTSAALKRHSDAGLLSINVLTDPTTGGVTASFAMLADIILAEPGALIGFAGPRVIEQTIRQKLPKGFQRSEFLLEHGFLDAIVKRDDLRDELISLLQFHQTSNDDAKSQPDQKNILSEDAAKAQTDTHVLSRKGLKNPWQRVTLARAKERPVAEDYIVHLFDHFTELHGDRQFGDDAAICGGIAYLNGKPVTVIAQMKGKNTKENLARNFAMPKPEGYRKALRLMKQAEKFHRPVICFVDTPGAFCGLEAEERGEGEAIARNLYEMSALKTPVLSILIGEGGSGGALALAVADEVWALENAIYSILSPEGFASILWKDAALAEKAAKVMRLTAYDLLQLGIIEDIIPEPEQYQEENMEEVLSLIRGKMEAFLQKKSEMTVEEILEKRYERFRAFNSVQ